MKTTNLGPLLAAVLLVQGCSALRNAEVRADVSNQVGGDFHYANGGHDYGGGKVAMVELSTEQPLSKEISLYGGVRHTSLIDTDKDRGEERMFLGIVWRPFK